MFLRLYKFRFTETYNSGFKIVREKCSQKYNTSSAEEQITAATYRREHPVLAMTANDGNIEHIFAEPDRTSKKHLQSKQSKNVKASSKKSGENIGPSSSNSFLLTDPRSVPDSSAEPTESSTMDSHVGERNANVEGNGRDERENDLNLDCGSEISVNNENTSSVTPQITSNDSEILVTKAVRYLNQTQSLSNRSNSSRSRSRSSRSGESRSSRSGGSRSSRSGGSRSSSSDSIRSHSNGSLKSHVSSSNQSHSSRSGSNVSRPDRSNSKSREHHRLNRSLQNGHSNRSRSIESFRSDSIHSIAKIRSPQMQKHEKNKNKADLSSNSEVKRPRMNSGNNLTKKPIKSTTKGSESNGRIKCSASDHTVKLSQSKRSPSIQFVSSRSRSNGSSSRSPSKSNRCSSRSRSRTPPSGYKTQVHQRRNPSKSNRCSSRSRSRTPRSGYKTQVHQRRNNSHRQSREMIRKKIAADESGVYRKNKRRRSSEPEARSHSKRSKIGSHNYSQSKIEERRSRSAHSSRSSTSPQQSHKHSHRRDVVKSHRRKNIALLDEPSTREKKSSSKDNFTEVVSVQDLMKVVKKIGETIKQNNQLLKDNDRRLHRMEVTVNKVLVLVGDLNGNGAALQDELLNEQGFEIPDLPITTTQELTVMKRKLKNKEFRVFFVSFFCFIYLSSSR